MSEKPITKIPINQSYASVEGLYKKFYSKENRGLGFQKTVEQVFEDDFEGYGPGRLVISEGYDKNSPVETVFYPNNPETQAYYKKQNQKANLMLGATNLPIILAPFLGMATGARNIFIKGQANKQWMVPQTKGGVPRIDQPLTEAQWQTINIFKNNSSSSNIVTNLMKSTGHIKTPSTSINKNIETSIQSAAIKTQTIIDKSRGINREPIEILNQEGLLHNVFRDGTKSADITKPIIKNNFTVSKQNLAPGIEKANIQAEVAEATRFHDKFTAIKGDLGESGLSIGSTIGKLEGQRKSFNLSPIEKAETVPRAVGETNIKEIPGQRGIRREITAEIENVPYKELHHIFGKAMGEKIISNVWKLINEGKATVEDLINLNYWAKHYGTGLGDFGAEAVNRVPHSATHTFSRKFGIEMLAEDIKAMPTFNNINDLTSYFRELLETRVKPMRGELDLQQSTYELLPKKMRIEVEQLKVAKEKASRDLTQSYKDIYGKKMKDTPETVKSAYETHIWIQEKLGVTEPELIAKAKKLDQARLAQDQQMAEVQKLIEVERNKAIQLAQSKQIKKERRGTQSTTRIGQSEEYAANRIDPEVVTERKMLEVGAPKTEAERQANIELIKSGIKPTDILVKDKKGKYTKKKTKK
tara:strand:- start:135 stop:2060 length:1926 start_codon:yes stop_codon:yes gene_type:complete